MLHCWILLGLQTEIWKFTIFHLKRIKKQHKKVLLRETARGVLPRHNLSKHIISWEGTYLGPGGSGYLLCPETTYLGVAPCPYLARGTYLGVPSPILTWLGVPTLDGGVTPLGYPLPLSWPGRWRYLPWTWGDRVPTLTGYLAPLPRRGGGRQKPVKTVPCRRTTHAGGNESFQRCTTYSYPINWGVNLVVVRLL